MIDQHRVLIATATLCASILVAASGAAQAALVDRGGGLIYDTDLNVTWLQDANYAHTSGYTTALYGSGGVGAMTWNQATNWAANLSYYDSVRNVTYDDWRLPTVTDTGAPGCDYAYSGTDCGFNVNTTASEMAHLFYDELGNTGFYDATGTPHYGNRLVNMGPFTNFPAATPGSFSVYEWSLLYWSGSETAPGANGAWYFNFGGGSQSQLGGNIGLYALAVRPGDVATVPVPAAAWLFGSGLLGLVGVFRRRTA
jgi:hypothetical protein